MVKRGLQDDVDDELENKAQFGQRRIGDYGDVEMGEFEDPWEDEFEGEEDEEIIEGYDGQGEDDDEDEGMLYLERLLTTRNERRGGRV